jgi:hypothetical protein
VAAAIAATSSCLFIASFLGRYGFGVQVAGADPGMSAGYRRTFEAPYASACAFTCIGV